MWYITIHFGSGVTGFICPSNLTKEEALKMCKNRLIKSISFLKFKYKNAPVTEKYLWHNKIQRTNLMLKSFQKPWRKHYKRFLDKTFEDDVLKIQRIDFPLLAGHWLEEIITQNYACNILPYEKLDGNNQSDK